MEENTPESKNSYGKRPLWQWIIVYIIIAGAVYGLFYYIFLQNRGGYQNQNTNSQSQNNNQTSTNYMIQNMKVEILQEGSGPEAKSGDTVTVNYTGTLLDGTKFDSSLNPGRTPFQFTIDQSQVIQGWHLGVKGMKVGEKRRLTIPPELAYGSEGAGGAIPPNATIVFEIDLLKIN